MYVCMHVCMYVCMYVSISYGSKIYVVSICTCFPIHVCMYACMYVFVQRVCIALKHVCLRIRLSLAVWLRMQQFRTGDSGGPGYQ